MKKQKTKLKNSRGNRLIYQGSRACQSYARCESGHPGRLDVDANPVVAASARMIKWSDDTIFSVRQGHSIDETPRVEAPPRLSLELGRHGLELMLALLPGGGRASRRHYKPARHPCFQSVTGQDPE